MRDWVTRVKRQGSNGRAAGIMARAVLLCAAAGVLAACAGTQDRTEDFQILYNRTAQYHLPDRNPIIVIPGILGSKLVDRPSQVRVWGAFEPGAADPQTDEGIRLISLPLSLEGEDLSDLRTLRDTVEPDGVLDRVRVRFGVIPLEIQAYVGILATLGAGGYRDEGLGLGAIDYGDQHFTCFQFAYDWRRDNVENAALLKQFIEEKQAYVAQKYKEVYDLHVAPAEIKFDIVAHSMGGLLTRYFLRYGDAELEVNGIPEVTWAGADYVERAILIGTPSSGSAESLRQLIEGKDLGPFLPYYQPALMGTFPSIYQLLPRSRHRQVVWDGDLDRPIPDLLDPDLWIDKGWGLAAPAEDAVLRRLLPDVEDPAARREVSLALLRRILERARAFTEALDMPARTPEGLELFLVAGDAEDTPEILSIDSETGAARVIREAAGDGTVLRSSALMDERIGSEWQPTLKSPVDWQTVMFLSANHLGLTRDPAFTDNVLYWLLEDPRTDLRQTRTWSPQQP